MSISLNRVILLGKVCGTPEVYNSSGTSLFCVIKLMTSKPGYMANGTAVPERFSYHRLLAWNKRAEYIRENVQTDAVILVEGEINYNSRTDNFGNTTHSTDIYIQSIEIIEKGLPNSEP